jgi:integrase
MQKPQPSKRAVKDVPIFLDKIFSQLNEQLGLSGWNYKENMEQFELRDKALFSLLVLTGGRASEIGLVKKIQFNLSPGGVILANFQTLKNGLLRQEIYLPRAGALSVYTDVCLEWLREIPGPQDHFMPPATPMGSFIWSRGLKRIRIWQIINFRTGLFPHWFRGVHETIYGRLILKNDAWKLKDYMGLKRVDSTGPYVRGELELQDKKRLNTL